MKSMRRQENYYEIEHPQYGVWYVTSLYKVAEITGLKTTTYIYQKKNFPATVNGWTITPVPDIDDIPYKWINPTIEKVINSSTY